MMNGKYVALHLHGPDTEADDTPDPCAWCGYPNDAQQFRVDVGYDVGRARTRMDVKLCGICREAAMRAINEYATVLRKGLARGCADGREETP